MVELGGWAWVLGRSATPGVIEGARYSFSPSRLGPLETEQKAGVRTGKPDFFVEEPMLSTGLHFASESTPSIRKSAVCSSVTNKNRQSGKVPGTSA